MKHTNLINRIAPPLAAALLLGLAAAPATAGITPPGATGVAKDRGFTLTPPWQRGKSYRMTCGYGCGKHQNKDYYALDFTMARGQPVHPAAPGKVLLAEAMGGGWEPYGNIVFLEHQNGYRTLYAHLDTLSVAAGAWVDVDTPLGTAGQSGSGASTDHLHFVLYKDTYVGYDGLGNRGPTGGTAVVPEPFSGCTQEAGGDCESTVYWDMLRRDDFAPEVIVNPDRSLDLFTCGRTTRNLLHRHRTAAGAWQAWNNLQGTCAGSPTAVRDAAGRVYVMVQGVDAKLWYKRRDSAFGVWNGWYPFSDTIVGRAAAALDTGDNLVRVFARRAPDHALYVATQSGTSFSGWTRLGGALLNSPAAARRGDGHVDAYVAGGDYSLYKLPANANGSYTVENWWPENVKIEGEPSFVVDGALDWVARSTTDQMVRPGGATVMAATHPPAAARNLNGLLHAFERNRNNSGADYAYQTGTGWATTGNTFGGLVTSEIAAVRAGTGEKIVMFLWGTGGLYYREQSSANSTTLWSAWLDLTVPQ